MATKSFLAKALRVARLIDEPTLAVTLLRPFRLEMLSTGHAKPLAALVDRYGDGWAAELVETWSAHRWYRHTGGLSREAWTSSLPGLCRSLRDTSDSGTRAPGCCFGNPGPGCDCELCGRLRAFLGNRSQTQLEWPLAQERRRHVHGRIDAAELPVDHKTRRVGRPYTLVLTKNQELFEREAQQRRGDRQNLAWLERTVAGRTARSPR